MKYLSKITFAIILSLTFFSCSEDDNKLEETQLIDNSETIEKLINSYDKTIKTVNLSNKLSDEEIGNIFIQEVKNQGLTVSEINNTSNKNSNDYDQSSNEYKEFALELIDASSFSSKEEYKNHLSNLLENVNGSDLNISEKQTLVDNILLTNAFVDWMETLNTSNKSNTFSKSSGSWWSNWGQCVAGTAGAAGTGALTFGLGGAAVGTVVLPVVGTVSAGAVGAIGGAIAGGLTGSVASC